MMIFWSLQSAASRQRHIMDKLAKRKIPIFYYVTGLLALILMSVALSIPYFLSVRDQFDKMVEDSRARILTEKKQILVERVERANAEISAMRATVYVEYQTMAQALCAMLGTLGMNIDNIIDAFDPRTTARTARFALHMPGMGIAIYDRKAHKVLWTDEDDLAHLLLDRLERGRAEPSDDFPVWAVGPLKDGTEVLVFGTDWAVDEIAKSRCKAILRTMRFPLNQYVWVNEVHNYSGGPGYAERAVHVAEPETEGMLLSTETADIKGNLPYKEELEGVVAHGSIFFTYYFKKPDSDEISEKLAYGKLYKPFNWIVCTGIYTNDMASIVQQREVDLRRAFYDQIISFARIISIMSLMYAVLMIFFERHLTGMIDGFIAKLKEDETALREEKDKLDEAYNKLERVAYYDFLTGLLNRRAMYERIEKEFSRAQREGLQFCLVLADIDHFKAVNDTHGHDAGDMVLRAVAKIFQNNIRQEDCASRWGGEEFLILAISCGLAEGLTLAEKLRKTVEQTPIRTETATINATITLGVVEYTQGKAFKELIKEADFYLYEGKRQRNCVMSSSGTVKES